jgi:hypothetical protein
MYEKIKAWHRDGRWTKAQVAMAVTKGDDDIIKTDA